MKPSGILILLAPIVFILIGFIVLRRPKNRIADIPTKLFIALLGIAIGTVTGFIVFIPAMLLCCSLMPNVSQDGHTVMPMAQAFLAGLSSIIMGLVVTTIAYRMILKWIIGKVSQ